MTLAIVIEPAPPESDTHGVIRVATTRVTLDTIVTAFLKECRPEDNVASVVFPNLPSPLKTMVRAAPKPLTLEEFLKLPETQPASEFIDGEIVQKPMPQGKHSTVQLDLGGDINRVLKKDRIARAYSELRCTFGGRSFVPDLSIFTWERIPRDANGEVANPFFLAPDWTIEILSPDQSQTKVVRNILHCLDRGTQMGWLIDPEEKLTFIYFRDRPISLFEVLPDAAPFLPVPDFAQAFQITAAEIFDYLSE